MVTGIAAAVHPGRSTVAYEININDDTGATNLRGPPHGRQLTCRTTHQSPIVTPIRLKTRLDFLGGNNI
ncbi:hypothetical protein [Catenulispora rubra]|uniref:hypothetical protein n=1 Tax=Catenulispora rubra TaxID=280293 RepID=UPI0018926334|nr:hypothetical protein [Catenulispora rubra]